MVPGDLTGASLLLPVQWPTQTAQCPFSSVMAFDLLQVWALKERKSVLFLTPTPQNQIKQTSSITTHLPICSTAMD